MSRGEESRGAFPDRQREAPGIECPECGCRHFYTIRTRRAPGGKIRRRKECRNCGRRVTTFESL